MASVEIICTYLVAVEFILGLLSPLEVAAAGVAVSHSYSDQESASFTFRVKIDTRQIIR